MSFHKIQSFGCLRVFSSHFTHLTHTPHVTHLSTRPRTRLGYPCLSWPHTPPFASRTMATSRARRHSGTKDASAGMYAAAAFISMLGLSYASVPLYRLFCANTGFSGTPVTDPARFSPDRLVPMQEKRRIRVTFESNVSDSLPWTFKPELREVYVVPGETALTFYRAKSQAKEDIVGIATYNVTPYRAGSYFNKIQCFCFDEQRLQPGEDVDMPVFFFIDPEFLNDPYMKDVGTITLGYTFFNARYAKNLSLERPVHT
ncbi:cytochrome c oxidase assembly protein CtaG/Cox11-domain-containing protein [Spinellus fusiger]|nr:cytochrome c oxidase assembly protein CtaG/Cox11-domain-containing protein [Spinellus fusiger]